MVARRVEEDGVEAPEEARILLDRQLFGLPVLDAEALRRADLSEFLELAGGHRAGRDEKQGISPGRGSAQESGQGGQQTKRASQVHR